MTSQKILVLGAETLTSTSPSKISHLASLASLGISFIPGNIATQSPPELITVFQPFDLVVSCLGFASGAGSQVKITRAVIEARVRRFVPWQFGVDYEVVGRGGVQKVWDEQLDVRDLLRGQGSFENRNVNVNMNVLDGAGEGDGEGKGGTDWIIVSTGMFMSFLFEDFFGVVDEGEKGEGGEGEVTVRALGSWENQVSVTTPDDIGKLTAMIVYEDPKIQNHVVYTAGETISYGKVADIMEKVTGRKTKREVCSVEKLKQYLRNDPEDNVKKYRVVFAERRGVSWDMEKTFNFQRGVEIMDVESFARGKFL